MKKYALLLLLVTLCLLAGCAEEESRFVALGIEHVQVIQNSAISYTVTVTAEETDEEAAVYFTRYDKLKDSDIPVEAVKDGSSYRFTANVPTGEYFVWVKTASATAMMSVSIPKMSPYVTVGDAAGGGKYAQVFYEIDGGSSWSSFVDPEGKNIYKSTNNKFDSSAVPVAENVSILDGSSTDPAYSSDSPYYYVVFQGKNRMLTFISYPLVEENLLFSSVAVSLQRLETRPTLCVDISTGENSNPGQYRLVVKSPTTGENYYSQPASAVDGKIALQLDVGAVQHSGVWYDIAIEDVAMGRLINLRSTMSDGSYVIFDGRNYHFKEWEGILKLNFDMVLTAYTVESATLTADESGKPVLTVTGAYLSGVDPNALKLAIRYEAGGEDKATVELLSNISTEPGVFKFVFDVTKLTAAGTWHDIDILYNGNYYTLYDTVVADMGVTVEYGGKTYSFKEWSHNLKLNFA